MNKTQEKEIITVNYGMPDPEKDPNWLQTDGFTSFSSFRYDAGWKQEFKPQKIEAKTIKIVTWNVWFDYMAKKERCDELMKISANADVICLQEVTHGFLKQILEMDLVRQSFYISDVNGVTVIPYGVVILSRIPISKLVIYNLPSKMARRFLVAHLIVNNEEIQVGTIHLESLNNRDVRKAQMEIISRVLVCSTNMWMGDFNIGAIGMENQTVSSLFPSHQDLWTVHHPNELGYTFDGSINKMLKERFESRIDRIMLQSKTWRSTSCTIIGNKPFQTDPILFPSDHFGLECTLEFQ